MNDNKLNAMIMNEKKLKEILLQALGSWYQPLLDMKQGRNGRYNRRNQEDRRIKEQRKDKRQKEQREKSVRIDED